MANNIDLGFSVIASIDPDAHVAGTYTTGWLSMADWQAMVAVIQVGTLGASATVDAKFEQASDSSGAGAKDLGTAITQMTTDNKQSVIVARNDSLDLVNDFTHVRLSVTVGVATSDVSAFVVGQDPRFGTHDANNASTVVEVV